MYYTVYRVTNILNGKIYVGAHRTENLDDGYMGSGKLILKAIQKYGKQVFIKEYLHIFDNAEDMFEMECLVVDSDFVSNPLTYNMALGGMGALGGINEYHSMQTAIKAKLDALVSDYETNPSRCNHCDSTLSYRKRKNKFCSSSCAATHNNKVRSCVKIKPDAVKNLTPRQVYEQNQKSCIECGLFLPFERRSANCCSRSCAAKQRNRGRPVSIETREKLSKAVHKSKNVIDNI